MECSHKSCSYEEKIWLPLEISHNSEAALHPWCIHCGLIKNISDDHAHKAGYWINILSTLAKHYSLKQIQKRLIIKEINLHEFFKDTYSITGSIQKKLFIRIIKKYCNINSRIIDSLIY